MVLMLMEIHFLIRDAANTIPLLVKGKGDGYVIPNQLGESLVLKEQNDNEIPKNRQMCHQYNEIWHSLSYKVHRRKI